jgi:hypothetical protein
VSVDSPWVRALRSVTVLTGIVCGAAAAVAYLAGGFAFDLIFGRPSPNEWAGTFIIGLPILGFGLAILGGLAGLFVQLFVRRSGYAGPADRRTVLAFMTIVSVVAALAGVQRGRQIDAPNRPRVMQTSHAIVRQQAKGDLIPVAPAAMIFEPFTPNSANITSLTWHGQRLHLSLGQDVLTIWLGEKELDAVDLRGLDAVTRAFGAIATLDDRAWLAILIRLRATGRRELLLIYDPAATLVHKELLRRMGPDGSARLSVVGERGQRQAFLIDVGEPLYFTAAR